MATRELAPDELAALEEQRDFLLASLDDLEREHAAGDVDEHDYVELRDDYTARAARVIRAIDAHRARVRGPQPSRNRWRMAGIGAAVVAFALLAGLMVADASGRRRTGDSLTGDIRQTTQDKLDEASVLVREDEFEQALALYDEILDQQPDHVQAMTYKGWIQFQSGNRADGLGTLAQAAELDPEYPEVHLFLAMVLEDLDRPDTARLSLDRLEELDPPPPIAQAAETLRQQLDAAPATTTPTTQP